MLAKLLQATHLIEQEYMMKREDVGYVMMKIAEPDLPIVTDEPLLFDNMRREPTLQMVSFVNVDTKGTSKCVYLSAVVMIKMFYVCVTPVWMSTSYHTI